MWHKYSCLMMVEMKRANKSVLTTAILIKIGWFSEDEMITPKISAFHIDSMYWPIVDQFYICI